MSPVFSGLAKGARPPDRISFEDWAAQHVKIVDGKSPYYDVDQAPWCREVMDCLTDHETREAILLWPTGSGKSTLFEAWFCWLVAQDPKSLQCSLQNDDAAKRWVEKRVMPTLLSCEPAAATIATLHRHKTRKLEVIFADHTFYFGGANQGRLQDVSCPLVLGQEVWCWKDGAIQDAKARDHDRWNAKTVFAGQGGNVGGEYWSECEEAELLEFWFRCPGCRRYAPWIGTGDDFRDDFRAALSWDQDEAEKEEIDWARIERSTHLVTRCCGRRFPDNVATRRKLALSGKYRSHGNAHVPGWKCFTFPALAMPHIPWSRLVREFILAARDEMAGASEKMRAFCNKRLARHWEEVLEVPQIDTTRDRYSRLDYWPEQGQAAPKWEDEVLRTLGVDVGKDHFWCVARAWKLNGDSLLLYEGRVESIELVRELQQRLDIQNPAVAVDCGNWVEQIAGYRMRFRDPVLRDGKPHAWTYWLMLKGDGGEGYPSRAGGPRRGWSNYVNSRTTGGIGYRFVKHSNLLCKDALAGLINSEGVYFGVPHDHSSEYGKQMRGEHKIEYRPGKWRWEKVTPKAPNHLWDAEVLGLVVASIKGILRIEGADSEAVTK